ncbi:MAG: hypothetical protein WAU82_07130 [Candidatus Binatus sp.]
MEPLKAFGVPAGLAVFVAIVGFVSVIRSRRRVARARREAEPERTAAYK